jgi:hypothetical protein
MRSKEDAMRTLGIALALVTVGCGKGRDGEQCQLHFARGAPAQTVALRLLGVGASKPVHVRVAALAAAVDGHALSTQLDGSEIDLGEDKREWPVTTLLLPVDAREVAIRLQFEPQGRVGRVGEDEPLEMSGVPLSLVVAAEQARAHGKAVVEIDAVRSLIQRRGQTFLLPDFVVTY